MVPVGASLLYFDENHPFEIKVLLCHYFCLKPSDGIPLLLEPLTRACATWQFVLPLSIFHKQKYKA